LPPSGSGDRLVVAVADGHGSSVHFRSDVGSSLAVAVALSLGQGLLASLPARGHLLAHPADDLAAGIAAAWDRATVADLTRRPFSVRELEALEAAHGPRGSQAIASNPLLAYGTTLILAIVAGGEALLLQIGDGDVLAVTPAMVTRPVPEDPRLFGGETTSLCLPDANLDFRLGRVRAADGERALLVLATDGFKNAYVDDEGFFSAGPPILACAERGGLEAVEQNLGLWLTEAGLRSGDDVSAAVVMLA